MTTSHLWQQAASFAARAHEHQLRNDGVTPFASHPVRVALTVACLFGITDETVLASALLHDVIEDCHVDYDELNELFGPAVADIVACLTKDKRLIEHEREDAYDRQLAAGPWEARLIKLADVYDNLADSRGSESRRAKLDKVRRALKIAADDPELAEARRIVAEFAASVEESLAAAR